MVSESDKKVWELVDGGGEILSFMPFVQLFSDMSEAHEAIGKSCLDHDLKFEDVLPNEGLFNSTYFHQ